MIKKLLSRVPEVGICFWIVKILSTTVGETGADFLAFNFGWGLQTTSLIMGFFLITMLFMQFKLKRYVPVSYWTVVVLMSVVGTLITDLLVDDLGVGLELLSIIFTIVMIGGFITWYKSEKTLSIHSIDTTRREMFYWVIILLAFALGTGIGDLISEGLALGYGVASLLFAGAIAMVVIGFYVLKLDSVLSFWIAFILTRPLGASIGDLLSKSASEGGIGLGTIITSAFFTFLIISIVIYLTVEENKKRFTSDLVV